MKKCLTIMVAMAAASPSYAGVNDDYRQVETAAYCIGVLSETNKEPILDGEFRTLSQNGHDSTAALINRKFIFLKGAPIRISVKDAGVLAQQGRADARLCLRVRGGCADKLLAEMTEEALQAFDQCESAVPVCKKLLECWD
jgi:hypothetical protein